MNASDAWSAHLDPLDDGPGTDLTPDQQRGVDAIRARLSDEAVWSEPRPDLRAALLARAAAEQDSRAAAEQGARDAADASGAPSPVTPLRRRAVRWLAAAATVAALGAGTVAFWPHPAEQTFVASGTALAPTANAVVRLEPKSAGLAIQMEITGLAPAPPGTYYAAWLRGPSGVVPVGTFHWRKGGIPIDLWSGVLTDDYPELFVTLQREGDPPEPSDQVVLDGRVS